MVTCTSSLVVLVAVAAFGVAPVAAAQVVDYRSSFKSPDEDPPPDGGVDSVDGTKGLKSPKGAKDMFDEEARPEIANGDSFPIWVSFDEAQKPDWKAVPADAQAPAKKTKRLKVKGCELTVETGAYTVNSYKIVGINDYELEQARIAPRTALVGVVGGPLFFSVTADLTVSMTQATASGCRKLFGSRRRHVIPALELTAVPTGVVSGKRVASTKTVREARGDRLYVGWSKEKQGLILLNKEGSNATTESAVVKFEPTSALGFYLSFAPAWKIVRAPKATPTPTPAGADDEDE